MGKAKRKKGWNGWLQKEILGYDIREVKGNEGKNNRKRKKIEEELDIFCWEGKLM